MKIEIWSDVVCPWCYIGKRRLEKALAEFPHREQVEITWRSFELDPSAPVQSELTLEQVLARKYGGGSANARRMIEHVSAVAQQDGLDYHLERSRPERSFDAHRLLHFAKTRGKQAELKERLLRAYFTEGGRLGEHDALVALASDVGLEPAESREILSDPERFAADVRTDERAAQTLGIQGVPFFVLEGRYGISGAQPVEVFKQALERAWRDMPSAP